MESDDYNMQFPIIIDVHSGSGISYLLKRTYLWLVCYVLNIQRQIHIKVATEATLLSNYFLMSWNSWCDIDIWF